MSCRLVLYIDRDVLILNEHVWANRTVRFASQHALGTICNCRSNVDHQMQRGNSAL